MDFDDVIFEAIEGNAEAAPVGIWSILACVDHYQRVLLIREEVAEGLSNLIQAGRIGEAGQHTYYDSTRGRSTAAFSGVSEEAYQQACAFYRQLAAEVLEEDMNEGDNGRE